MTASLLVATPHPAFGELLRSSLEENGKYRVHVSLSAREARASSLHGVFQLAILDFALTDEPFIPLCYDLLDQQKGLRLVVVPPENNPNHPALGGLMPHGYLSRPFYLPDLLDTVSRLLDERNANPNSTGMNGRATGLPPADKTGIRSYTLPEWLADPQILTSYLEQQLPHTQALAALVGVSETTPGSGILHASAGKLNATAAQEMTGIVFRYWNRSKKADLMRFVRLNSEKQDFLIYATPLVSDLVLTLIYDTSSPLSQVRPQTKAVAQALASEPPEGFQTSGGQKAEPKSSPDEASVDQPEAEADVVPPAASEISSETAASDSVQALPSTGPLEMPPVEESAKVEPAVPYQPAVSAAQEPETQPLDDPFLIESNNHEAFQGATSSQDAPTPVENQPNFEPEDYEEGENQVINLSSLLGNIPKPDPGKESPDAINASWMTSVPSISPRPQTGFNGWQPAGGMDFDRPDEPTVTSAEEEKAAAAPDWWVTKQPEKDITESLTVETPVPPGVKEPAEKAITSARPETLEDEDADESQLVLDNEAPIDPLEDTRPRVLTAISSINQLEPVSPALSLLNYTCVLVPRLPQHYLTGELADRLSHWVQQLCLAFGWRLEGISVRPEYLQWTLQVAPSVSPGNLVRIIRQRTSINIFSHFAHLAEQNPSGDFWATGYLIVSGSQPPSAQLMRDYISQTRKRQGIAR